MNGPVFCAAVLARRDWSTPASLIGHSSMVQVAAYNPLLFLRDASQPPSINNVSSLLAISSQGTVSLWFTDLSQPFAVLNELFDRDVLDLSWSKDGKQLWASSSDGQVAVVTFDYAEFAPVAPAGTQQRLFAEYGYAPRRLATAAVAPSPVLVNGGGGGTESQPNALVARKGPGAKRPRTVPLQTTSPFANAAVVSGPAPPINAFASTSAAAAAAPFGSPAFGGVPAAPAASTSSVQINDLTASRKRKAPTTLVADQVEQAQYYPPPPQVPGYGSAPRLSDAPYRLNGDTVGRGDPAPPDDQLRELVPAFALYDREVTFRITNRGSSKGKGREEGGGMSLAVPAVMSMGKLGIEDSDAKDTLEWRNFADGPRGCCLFRSLAGCTA